MKVKASKKGGGLPSLTSPHTPLPEIQRIKQTLCVIALRLLVQGQGHYQLKAISVEKKCFSEQTWNNSRKESRVDQIRFSTLPNNFGAEESSKKGLSLCDTVPTGSNPHQTVIKENPFRRVFAKRKQFYQRLSDQAAANRQNVSAPLWRRNCETTTNKLQNQQVH